MATTLIEIQRPHEARELIRSRSYLRATTGVCAGYLQANLIVLPEKYAADFRDLCARNPVPCPLLGETALGDPSTIVPAEIAIGETNIATDIPFYYEYVNGEFVREHAQLTQQWSEKYIGFLLGCSYSFEAALAREGLMPRHMIERTAVPMFKTTMMLATAGVFHGHYIVSMRPYKKEDLERVRAISREFRNCHGEPVAWGWDGAKALGIEDVSKPDFGEPVPILEGEIPVFWGCGVTPQFAVMESKLPEPVYSHRPGFMYITDLVEPKF